MENRYLFLKYNKNNININLNELIKIGNYNYLMMNLETENSIIKLTGVFDKNYNIVIRPCINEIEKNEIDNFISDDLIIFKDDKIIYFDTENYYLIDLKKIKYNKDKLCNYLYKFNAYYNIGDSKIVIYSDSNSFIYDIDNNKLLTYTFDNIIVYKNSYEAYIKVDNKYSNPLISKLFINKDYEILNEILLDDYLTIIASDEILNDKQKLIKYIDSCYNMYIESENKCKIKQ